MLSGGDHGWEEVPYWLKGYGDLAYILKDSAMIAETKVWIEAAIQSRQPDGFFGPVNERGGKRELWANMDKAFGVCNLIMNILVIREC